MVALLEEVVEVEEELHMHAHILGLVGSPGRFCYSHRDIPTCRWEEDGELAALMGPPVI